MTDDKNVVILSVNMPGSEICVDFFKRPDGSFGFEEFRRDCEDGRGWFPIGGYAHRVFETFEDARHSAQEKIGWLKDALLA